MKVFKKRNKKVLTSYEAIDAKMIDQAQEEKINEKVETEAPSDEFEKIISTMTKRDIEVKLVGELLKRTREIKYYSFVKKPVVVGLLAIMLVGITSMGVSAKKAYDFRMREQSPGRSNIIWNNDDKTIVFNDVGLDEAYIDIESNLGFDSVKFGYMPSDFSFISLELDDIAAYIKFDYKGHIITLLQSKSPLVTTGNSSSDRSDYLSVYNPIMNKNVMIEKNLLPDGSEELSISYTFRGVLCCLQGKILDDDLIRIVEELYY